MQKSFSPVILNTQLNHVHCVLKFFILFLSSHPNQYASESPVAFVVAVCVYKCVDAIKSNFILRRVNPLDRSLKYRTNKFRMCAFPPRRSDVQFMPKNLKGTRLNLCEGVDAVSLLVPVQMVP